MDQRNQGSVMQAHGSGQWRADLRAAVAQNEGWTPYIHEAEFDVVAELRAPYEDDEEVDRATIFEDNAEAQAWRNAQIKYHKEDPTLPQNDEERKAIVKLLFKAFKSVAKSRDNASMKKLFLNPAHDNARVEVVCWLMLDLAETRATNGPLLQGFKPKNAKEDSTHLNFEARINEMVTSLSEEKTICKHLMDAPYVMTFVDDPVHARRRTLSNRDLNKKKGTIMAAGKKATGLDKPKVTPRRATKLRARRARQQPSEESDEGEGHDMSSSSSPFNATPDSVNGSPDANMSSINTFKGSRSNARPVDPTTPITISNGLVNTHVNSTLSPLANYGENSQETLSTPMVPMAAPAYPSRARDLSTASGATSQANVGNGRGRDRGRDRGRGGLTAPQHSPFAVDSVQEHGGRELLQSAGVQFNHSPDWPSTPAAQMYPGYGISAQVSTTQGYGFPQMSAIPRMAPSMGPGFSQRTTPSPTAGRFTYGLVQQALQLPDMIPAQNVTFQPRASPALAGQMSNLGFSPAAPFLDTDTLAESFDPSMHPDMMSMMDVGPGSQNTTANSMSQQPIMYQRQPVRPMAATVARDSSTSSNASFADWVNEDDS